MKKFVKENLSKMSGIILCKSSELFTKQPICNIIPSRTTTTLQGQHKNFLPKSSYDFDETDNNTHSDLTQTSIFKPNFVMDERFHREDERLKTFAYFPVDWLDKKELAMSGMFFLGDGDKTKCYFCEVEIGCWEHDDRPVPEHLRWSPNCPLLRRRTTNNVPINCEALDRLLPPPSYDICGFNEHIEVRQNGLSDGYVNEADIPNSPAIASGSGSSSSSAPNYYPEYPEYAIETARLRTFKDWPRNMKQKPIQLAEAGFFYTGTGDRVKCFSCGGGLKDWDDNDEPWEQHALWMGKCHYVKLVKGDTYIETVKNRFKKSFEEGESQNAATTAPSTATGNNATVLKEPTSNQTTTATITTTSQSETENSTAPSSSSITKACGGVGVTVGVEEENKNSCSSIPEEKLCKICYANEYNTAFLPCGHVVACAKCASSVTKCPMCRKPFANVMRVYFS